MKKSKKYLSFYIYCSFFAIFILSFSLSWFVFFMMKNRQDLRDEIHFFRGAETLSQFIEEFLHHESLALDLFPSLFESNNEISYSKFDQVTRTINNIHPNIMIEYMPLVERKEIFSFEKKAQRLFPGYKLKEKGEDHQIREMKLSKVRKHFFPIYYTSNSLKEENQKLLGFDVFSSSTHRSALIQAVETGEKIVVMESFFPLKEENKSYKSFVVFKAIYSKGLPKNTKEEKWRATLGVISTLVQVDGILKEFFHFDERFPLENQGEKRILSSFKDSQFLPSWKQDFQYDFSFFFSSKEQFHLIYDAEYSEKRFQKISNQERLEPFYREFIYEENKKKINVVKNSIFSSPSLVYFNEYDWIGQKVKWLITFRDERIFWSTYWEIYLVLFFGFLLIFLLVNLMLWLARKKTAFN